MNRSILIFIGGCMVFTSCGTNQLDKKNVVTIFREERVYPKVVEYRIFAGNNETASELHQAGLDQRGYVTVQLEHTENDIGKPLINFTDKAKPYLLETSELQKSVDAQNVKLADEYFRDVTEITTNAKGDRAEVEFTTSYKNPTPFMVLSRESKDSIQSRMTYFTLKGDHWMWEGKIMKMHSKLSDDE